MRVNLVINNTHEPCLRTLDVTNKEKQMIKCS